MTRPLFDLSRIARPARDSLSSALGFADLSRLQE